jgi:hypothetical protein
MIEKHTPKIDILAVFHRAVRKESFRQRFPEG